MKITTEITLRYLDHIRELLKSVKPARYGLLEDSHLKSDRHGTKLELLLSDTVIIVDVHVNTNGYVVILAARQRHPSFANEKPLMFTHIGYDRSELFEQFKSDIDVIFSVFVNRDVRAAHIVNPQPIGD